MKKQEAGSKEVCRGERRSPFFNETKGAKTTQGLNILSPFDVEWQGHFSI